MGSLDGAHATIVHATKATNVAMPLAELVAACSFDGVPRRKRPNEALRRIAPFAARLVPSNYAAHEALRRIARFASRSFDSAPR